MEIWKIFHVFGCCIALCFISEALLLWPTPWAALPSGYQHHVDSVIRKEATASAIRNKIILIGSQKFLENMQHRFPKSAAITLEKPHTGRLRVILQILSNHRCPIIIEYSKIYSENFLQDLPPFSPLSANYYIFNVFPWRAPATLMYVITQSLHHTPPDETKPASTPQPTPLPTWSLGLPIAANGLAIFWAQGEAPLPPGQLLTAQQPTEMALCSSI